MTRPDVEGLRHEDDAPWVTELLDYICALEAARDTVLAAGDGRNSQPFWQSVRAEFDAALARWTP